MGDIARRAGLPSLWHDLRAQTHQWDLLLARLQAVGLPEPSRRRPRAFPAARIAIRAGLLDLRCYLRAQGQQGVLLLEVLPASGLPKPSRPQQPRALLAAPTIICATRDAAGLRASGAPRTRLPDRTPLVVFDPQRPRQWLGRPLTAAALFDHPADKPTCEEWAPTRATLPQHRPAAGSYPVAAQDFYRQSIVGRAYRE
jgi:hypothetical protein